MMHSPVEQEPALVRGRLAPFGFIPLAPRSDEAGHLDAEAEDTTEGEDGAACGAPGFAEADVFSDRPVDRGRDVGLAPFDEFAGSGNVGCNRLFGEDVLAGGEGLLDDFGLDENWEAASVR